MPCALYCVSTKQKLVPLTQSIKGILRSTIQSRLDRSFVLGKRVNWTSQLKKVGLRGHEMELCSSDQAALSASGNSQLVVDLT